MYNCWRGGTPLSSVGSAVVPISDTVEKFVIALTADDGAAGVTDGRAPVSCACDSAGCAANDASTQELNQDPARAAILINRGDMPTGDWRSAVTIRREDLADG